jgi:hypothetical protein
MIDFANLKVFSFWRGRWDRVDLLGLQFCHGAWGVGIHRELGRGETGVDQISSLVLPQGALGGVGCHLRIEGRRENWDNTEGSAPDRPQVWYLIVSASDSF